MAAFLQIGLRVRCDCAAARSVAVTVGAPGAGGGPWARIELAGPLLPAEEYAPDLRVAALMLAAGLPGPPWAVPRVAAEGPDAPRQAEDFEFGLCEVWLRLCSPSRPPSAPGPAAAPAPGPAYAPGPAAPDPPGAEVGARRVRAAMGSRGGAPDFASERASDRRRAHNYIRSVMGEPGAPEELVEAVRVRLARGLA